MKWSLVVIGILFIVLWVTCLFFSNKTPSIHIALSVALVFFLPEIMTKQKSKIVTEGQNTNVQSLKNKETSVATEVVDTDVQL